MLTRSVFRTVLGSLFGRSFGVYWGAHFELLGSLLVCSFGSKLRPYSRALIGELIREPVQCLLASLFGYTCCSYPQPNREPISELIRQLIRECLSDRKTASGAGSGARGERRAADVGFVNTVAGYYLHTPTISVQKVNLL